MYVKLGVFGLLLLSVLLWIPTGLLVAPCMLTVSSGWEGATNRLTQVELEGHHRWSLG